jgi:LacI family transcriptional regulator
MRIERYISSMTVQNQIAETLCLSQGTVSRALRNRPGIRPEVRIKVLKAASELGYRLPRNAPQQAGATTQDYFAGVLLHAPHDKWRSRDSFMVGLCAVAPSIDTTLVLHHINTPDCDSILIPDNQPPVMRQGTMKALVLVFRWPHHVVKKLAERFACVSLQHEYPGLPVDVVSVNYTQAIHDLVAHLHTLGHSRIGFLGRSRELSWSRARFAGYVDALRQFDLDYDPRRVIDIPTPDLEAYDRPDHAWSAAVDQVIKELDRGTRAWVCSSDYAAYTISRGLLDRGIRIPADISLTGFDAWREPLFDCPLLTAAAVPQQAMGAAALRIVINRVRTPDQLPSHTLFNCTFRQGVSTGPTPRG